MCEVTFIQLFEDSSRVMQKEFGNWKNYLTFTSCHAVFLTSLKLFVCFQSPSQSALSLYFCSTEVKYLLE